MRKHILFWTEFILVLFFFVFPPIFTPAQNPEKNVPPVFAYPPQVFFMAGCAVLIYINEISRKPFFLPLLDVNTALQNKTENNSYTNLSATLVAFGALCLTGVFSSVISRLFLRAPEPTVVAAVPKNIFNFIFGTLCAAVYEEIIYRFYLPAAFRKAFSFLKGRYAFLLYESIPVILFACGHIYNGMPALMNAFAAGIILRMHYRMTKSLSAVTAVHALYNFGAFAAVSFAS